MKSRRSIEVQEEPYPEELFEPCLQRQAFTVITQFLLSPWLTVSGIHILYHVQLVIFLLCSVWI